MLNIGLTGNIASGKSTVSRFFEEWGATIVDADKITREVQAPGSAVLTAIAERFGSTVIKADGSLDRDTLRPIVFGDNDALASLNAIVHPAVNRRREELMAAAQAGGCKVVVNVIPLLFEVLNPEDFDIIVLVDAPEHIRASRLVRDRGLSNAEAADMISAQLPASEKAEKSDHVINNSGDRFALEKAARAVWLEVTGETG